MEKWYRRLPKMDTCLADQRVEAWIQEFGYEQVKEAFASTLGAIRELIHTASGDALIDDTVIESEIASLFDTVENRLRVGFIGLRPVINGTGTLLHTNLGRANFSKDLVKRAVDKASRYSNLEYQLDLGRRGSRYDHIEGLLCALTGAEAAMAVNNNAAAVMLMLAALCQDQEVVVSRGELVEIGGSFRIPDVMRLSGAKLLEVGTTNRTRLSDYYEATGFDTGAYLKVHTSNYQILGFTESTSLKELVALSHKTGVPVLEDQGSGVLTDLTTYGLPQEATVQASIAAGVDLVTFSGDKLLGGPQAGFLVGKKKLIERCKSHQLNRALRVDKVTLALAEETLRLYLHGDRMNEIPFYWMLGRSQAELQEAAEKIQSELSETAIQKLGLEIRETEGTIGGGSLPGVSFLSLALVVSKGNSAMQEAILRQGTNPVVARIQQDEVWIDLRTIYPDQWKLLVKRLRELEDMA
ncbi:L-seryl-tRNA(Sec) selenium transferase [Gottschalkiaceae bacterium SANA]|nr:L-seryl-tRNA(Sec) selenium transferase [Gottschalkiaceae bacterium SANA]